MGQKENDQLKQLHKSQISIKQNNNLSRDLALVPI